MEESQSEGSSSGSLSSGAVVGVVFAVIIVLLLIAISATLIGILTHRRKMYSFNREKNGINNPNYGKCL